MDCQIMNGDSCVNRGQTDWRYDAVCDTRLNDLVAEVHPLLAGDVEERLYK
jgi:hypothetical protein